MNKNDIFHMMEQNLETYCKEIIRVMTCSKEQQSMQGHTYILNLMAICKEYSYIMKKMNESWE